MLGVVRRESVLRDSCLRRNDGDWCKTVLGEWLALLLDVGVFGPGDGEFFHTELDGIFVVLHVEVDLVPLPVMHPVHDDHLADAFDVNFLAAGQAALLQVSGDRDDSGPDLVSPGADVRGVIGLLGVGVVCGCPDNTGNLGLFLFRWFLLVDFIDFGLHRGRCLQGDLGRNGFVRLGRYGRLDPAVVCKEGEDGDCDEYDGSS